MLLFLMVMRLPLTSQTHMHARVEISNKKIVSMILESTQQMDEASNSPANGPCV